MLTGGQSRGWASRLPEWKEAQAHHPIVFYNIVSPTLPACSGNQAKPTPSRGDYNLYMGGQQRTPRGLAFEMTLPVPGSGSIIRAHSSTDTHPKGRNRGIDYTPVAKTQATRLQERERLAKGRNQASSDSNFQIICPGRCCIHRTQNYAAREP